MKRKFITLLTMGILVFSATSITSANNITSDNTDFPQEIMNEDPNATMTIIKNEENNPNSRVFVGKNLVNIKIDQLSSGNIITSRNQYEISPTDVPSKKVGVEYSSNVARQTVGICYYDGSSGKYVSEGSTATNTTSGAVSFKVNFSSNVKHHFAFVKNTNSGLTIKNAKFNFIGM